MILVQNIGRLQQYNLCRNEKPYCETVVMPADVQLQGKLPNELFNAYSLRVLLMDCTGTVLTADVTGYFRVLFGVSSYNERYFNLELREWAPAFPADGCFILKVEVKNNGVLVFDRITEMYCRRQGFTACFVAISEGDWYKINTDGFIEINCKRFPYAQGLQAAGYTVQFNEATREYLVFFDCELTTLFIAAWVQDNVPRCLSLPVQHYINIDGTRCKKPLIRINSTFDCRDDISGAYYGDPSQMLHVLNATNDNTVIFTNQIWIEAEFKVLPTELKRQKTNGGKTTSTEYVRLFQLLGLSAFPEWKMLEIERLLNGKRIFIDGIERIFPGGTPFKKDTIRSTCNWLLDAKFEDIPLTNDFNCLDECTFLCTWFVIPAGSRDQNYYDETGLLVAITLNGLIDWYRGRPDTVNVSEAFFDNLDCEPVAIFKVNSYGYVPNFFYYGENSIGRRVYGKRDDCSLPKRLCEGMPSGCRKPENLVVTFTPSVDPECPRPVLLSINLMNADDWQDCVFEGSGTWSVLAGSTIQHSPAGRVRIAFTARSAAFTDVQNPYIASELIGILAPGCRPLSTKILTPNNTPGMPANQMLEIRPDGQIIASSSIYVTGSYGEVSVPLIEFDK